MTGTGVYRDAEQGIKRSRPIAAELEARQRGVDATCETCPQYLVMTEEDLETLGAVAKCAPPLRPRAERDALWEHLRRPAGRLLGPLADPARDEDRRRLLRRGNVVFEGGKVTSGPVGRFVRRLTGGCGLCES